jgi:uncharacterized membrane protein YeaQ/YmgE (transglycosylase-associated protein family)
MKKGSIIVPLIIFLTGIAIYWSSAYPSITWWETSEYAGAAVGLGISGPPGSLLLTIAGWILSKLTPHDPAFLFNLFAGVIGSLAVTFCYIAFRKINAILLGTEKVELSFPYDLMMAIGSGIIICSSTLWEYSIMFAPYVLTGLFTILILLSILNWWERSDREDSWKQLFVIALLFGVDFSVHRTNAVLMPGVLLLVLIRKPKAFLNYRSYIAAFCGLFLGLSLQLLYIPISLRDPSMNMGQPDTLAGWWYYFSLKQYGGNFLMDIFTRKSPLFSYQIHYYLKGFADNFLYYDHKSILPGFFPGLLGLAGLISLFRRNRKLAVSLLSFLLVTIIVSIIYFNLPADYFRSIYRHYLPTFIIFSVFIFYGLEYVTVSIKKFSPGTRWGLYSILIILVSVTFFNQYLHNIGKNNGAGNNFAAAHAGNIIKSIDRGGIVFSYGDNDYFPEIYVQEAQNVRPDIIQCNLSLLNADWYIRQTLRHHKDLPYRGDGIDISGFEFLNWKPQYISIPLSEETRKNYNIDMDSVRMTFPVLRKNNSNYLQDLVLFDIIKNNRWERPVYFIKSAVESELYGWLEPNLRDQGLVYKFVPDTLNKVDFTTIIANIDKFDLTGYADRSTVLDEMSLSIGRRYYDIFLKAAEYKVENKDPKGASLYLEKMMNLLPFERVMPAKEIIERTNRLKVLLIN